MTSIKWLLRLLLTSFCLVGLGYALVSGPPWLIIGLACLSLYFLFTLFQIPMQVLYEVKDFALSIKYKDFARHFATKKQREEIKILRSSFNEIHDAIKEITREKEAQYHYLQKMLDWIDTGILLYKPESGEVVWMNEALKKLWGIPYLKTIDFLEKRNPKLFDKLVHLGNHSEIYQEENKMLLTGTSFSTDGIMFKLIAVKNVNEVLAENEVQSWQKLLSVLTHEIMNSVAPISSLADTLKKRLGDSEDDLAQGIDTIKSRSEGLLKFTAIYRNLNKITSLNTESILVRELFENIYRLMDPTLSHKSIELQVLLRQPNMCVIADKALLEQVLINLILNALEAVKEVPEPKISLSASLTDHLEIMVSDNGTGIEDEVLDKIFVPFFTTKKKGSGIGLSLCKQIVSLHKGSLLVRSKVGQGSVFTIVLPAF